MTGLDNMFKDASNLSHIENIENWDTSNIASMYYTFCRDALFNQDIANWDVSNVTTMFAMLA